MLRWARPAKKRGGRGAVWAAAAELQGPESVDREPLSVGSTQLSAVLEVPVCQLLVRVDLPVTEVSDEEIAAEASEVRPSEGESPWRVQLTVLRYTHEQIAGRVIGVDEAKALSGDFVMRSLVLLRVRDEDARADRLDPERRVAVRKLRVDKLPGVRDEGEGAVEDVDVRVVEVGGVEQVAGWRRREREPLVDRAEPRAIGEDDGLVPL